MDAGKPNSGLLQEQYTLLTQPSLQSSIVFLRQGLINETRLASDLCQSCASLHSARITDVGHQAGQLC